MGVRHRCCSPGLPVNGRALIQPADRSLLNVPGRAARAAFLDRDGVLNRNIFYPDTGAWESPRSAAQLWLASGVVEGLRALRTAGFALVLVSNQPNAAKGKSTEAELHSIHARLVELLAAEGLSLDAAFYCYHHPAHTGPCLCRKPSPHFLLHAAQACGFNLADSWMIGDRASDVECGRRAGVRTAWINTGEGVVLGEESPDFVSADLAEAARLIVRAALHTG